MMGDELENMLPTEDSPIAVLGSIHCVLRQVGEDLGERYVPIFEDAFGIYWDDHLQALRQKQINVYDAHFVLLEPLKHWDSPVRTGMALDGIKLQLMEDALHERNRWAHHILPDLTLEALAESIKPFHKLATALELGTLGKLCALTKQRIKDIADGTYKPRNASTAGSALADLKDEHAKLQQQKAALEAEVLKAVTAAARVAGAGEAAQARADERTASLQEQLREALRANAELEFKIEAIAASSNPAAPSSPVEAIVGHAWPAELPQRELVPMALHNDLFDPTASRPISDEFGESCKDIIRGWKTLLTPNAKVRCNEHGQCVAFIGGIWAYLGTLGSTTDKDSAVGFFLPGEYTLRMNGDIEDRETGELLSDYIDEDVAAALAGQLLTQLPEGGRLRLDPQRRIAANIAGTWRDVGVTADDWFQ